MGGDRPVDVAARRIVIQQLGERAGRRDEAAGRGVGRVQPPRLAPDRLVQLALADGERVARGRGQVALGGVADGQRLALDLVELQPRLVRGRADLGLRLAGQQAAQPVAQAARLAELDGGALVERKRCLLYTSPSPRD